MNVRSDEVATPLMNSIQSGKLENSAFLPDRGADPNAADLRGCTPLHRAAEMVHEDQVPLLVEKGGWVEVGHNTIADLLSQKT